MKTIKVVSLCAALAFSLALAGATWQTFSRAAKARKRVADVEVAQFNESLIATNAALTMQLAQELGIVSYYMQYSSGRIYFKFGDHPRKGKGVDSAAIALRLHHCAMANDLDIPHSSTLYMALPDCIEAEEAAASVNK